MSEAILMREIQVAVSEKGHRVFRNNQGVCKTEDGRYIRYGVCNPGGADLLGWTSGGRFLAIEVKGPKGRLTKEQDAFLTAVNEAGGVGICAKTIDDVRERLG